MLTVYKRRLRIQAAQHGRSMGEEAREILRTALSTEAAGGRSLVASIRARVKPFSGVDLALLPREPMRDPMDFGE